MGMGKLWVAVAAIGAFFLQPCHAQTLVGDGVTDNTPIWNQIVASKCASQDRAIDLGKGQFRFASQMQPIPCSLKVVGQGWGVSVLKFDYSDTNGYWVIGGMDPYGGGILRDVSMTVASGRTIGFCVHIQAHLEADPNTASRNPHGWTGDNISCGRDGMSPPFTGSFNYGVYLDGAANASPPNGVAPGIRYVRLIHSSISGFNILPALAYYAYGSRFFDFDCYIGIGGAPYRVQGTNDANTTMVYSQTCPYQNVP